MNTDVEFTVVLPSNGSIKKYPANKPSSFTTPIPGGYSLEGSWSVTLMSLTFPSKVKQTGAADHGCMLVYTDIVTDTLIGGVMAPILAVLPVSNNTYYSPTHLTYRTVKGVNFNEISIKIADIKGREIEFENPNIPLTIELHFKRRPF